MLNFIDADMKLRLAKKDVHPVELSRMEDLQDIANDLLKALVEAKHFMRSDDRICARINHAVKYEIQSECREYQVLDMIQSALEKAGVTNVKVQ